MPECALLAAVEKRPVQTDHSFRHFLDAKSLGSSTRSDAHSPISRAGSLDHQACKIGLRVGFAHPAVAARLDEFGHAALTAYDHWEPHCQSFERRVREGIVTRRQDKAIGCGVHKANVFPATK